MNKSASVLTALKKWPGGLWFFTRLICFKVPYFSSIYPAFTTLEPGKGEAIIRKRRAVQNHLGTVHAIAIANLCELVAGTTLEVTLPNTHRWIPKSMTIQYLEKANSDIRAATTINLDALTEAPTSLFILVNAVNDQGVVVVSATIEMYITKRG